MIKSADYIVDLGPGAGEHGGEIVFHGTYEDILKYNSITSDYLSGVLSIKIPKERRHGNGNNLELKKGASGNNLKKC